MDNGHLQQRAGVLFEQSISGADLFETAVPCAVVAPLGAARSGAVFCVAVAQLAPKRTVVPLPFEAPDHFKLPSIARGCSLEFRELRALPTPPVVLALLGAKPLCYEPSLGVLFVRKNSLATAGRTDVRTTSPTAGRAVSGSFSKLGRHSQADSFRSSCSSCMTDAAYVLGTVRDVRCIAAEPARPSAGFGLFGRRQGPVRWTSLAVN